MQVIGFLRTLPLTFLCFAVRPTFCTMAEKTMRAVQYTDGPADNLRVGQEKMPEVGASHVLMKVYYSAINRADTLQRQGKYPVPAGASPILGLEAAGVVHKVGDGVSKWQEGDRIMALLGGGGNAECVAVHEDHVIPVPSGMSLREAAAVPEVWLTAYQLLHFVGHVKGGEHVLIHAGGSGVGTAAVQLTRLAGAVPYITAGSGEKIERVKQLGAEEGFNYKTEDFSEGVKNVTGGGGVELVLDCVGASHWQKNVDSLAVDGRWVLYGLLGGGAVEGNILGQLLRKRATLVCSLLRSRSSDYKAELVKAFTEQALPAFASGKLRPVIDRVFPLGQIAAAHKHMESNTSFGKILLQVRMDPQHHDEM